LVELVGYVDVDLRTLEPAALASVAVVVDPRKPKEERVRLVDLGRSDAWIEDLEALPAAVGASDGEAMRAVSRKLYDAIWAPLVPALGDADRVLLVPDGRMHLVPFSALVDADGRYLAETTRLTLLSSSRDLLRRRKSRARGKQGAPVIIAGPAFGGQREKATQRLSRVTFSPLPGAEAEGREVAQVMSAGKLAPSLLIGEAARESALASVASPRILHLATHGFVSLEATGGRAASRGVKLGRLKAGIEKVAKKKDETVEAEIGSWSVLDALVRTGVALSGANEPAPLGEEDGILTGLEALALDLDGTELVVLSACETGLGRLVTQGEGVYGLRRAFQEAGARSVVSTLWPIDDAATRAFMTSFYRHFLGGASASDAVRAAQQAFIANPRWKHPYYWAAFTAVERR
jgi:CHAT domain-containing protein